MEYFHIPLPLILLLVHHHYTNRNRRRQGMKYWSIAPSRIKNKEDQEAIKNERINGTTHDLL